MDYVLVLKNGIGNKVFALVYFLHTYPHVRLHVVDSTSHHNDEKVKTFFKHIPVHWISWKDYDSMKQHTPELKVPYSVYYDTSGFTSKMKKIFQTPKLSYDFQKGIFVHVRYGDKFEMNYFALKNRQTPKYILLKPSYYETHIQMLLDKKEGPVYIFSDDPTIARCLLKPDYVFVHASGYETFSCFQHAKRVILSESTLSTAAVLLGKDKKDLIVPDFLRMPPDFRIVPSPYFTNGVRDTSYILSTKSEYDEILKQCK
uniref:Uncharacterized protein n=1 Tax=viral metagenome TaxID=1070528 RepID=A0A6C0JWU4_9ZZZZ